MSLWKMADPLMRHQGEKVLARLLENGYQAYFVGGCVRDEIMGRPVHDMDIATSAKPEDVIRLFDRTIPTGLQHGTVTVVSGDHVFEVTTFRKEAEYEDHRHPSSVEFVERLTEDLQRRDFTMNAIAGDGEGRLTDPFGGREDIEAGLIRCVGDASERFDEDALRMIRAVRFASVFAFRPVKSLWSAMRAGRSKIAFIAMERIRTELEKIVLGPYPVRGLAMLQRSGLLEYVKAPVPQAALVPFSKTEERSPWIAALERCSSDQPEIRWSLLLQALDVTGDESASLMKEWTFSNAAAQMAAALVRFDELWSTVKLSGMEERLKRQNWIELQLAFGKAVAANWLLRQETLLGALSTDTTTHERLHLLEQEEAKWHEEVVIHTLQELAVTGGDVIQQLGKRGGPWLGELMNRLLLGAAAGDLANERETLLEHAKVVVNDNGTS